METLCQNKPEVEVCVSEITVKQPRIVARVLENEPVHEAEEAVEYDQMVEAYQWLLNKPFVEMLAKLPLKRGRILDIGTGPGRIPIALSKLKPDWEIWGIDASGDMLERGRSHAQEAGVSERVHFKKGDALKLPFDDGYFDVVCSHFVLHHIEKPEEMLNEAARVTRGGGKVLIKDLKRQPRWKAGILMAFSKYILRYSECQLDMYRDSLGAALTMEEIHAAVGKSNLSMAELKGFRGLDFVISA